MAAAWDVIVIGAGLNGLTAAHDLRKGGRRVLVLESRGEPGGRLVSEQLAPGFRYDPASSDPGWLSPKLIHDLDFQRYGLELLAPQPALVGLSRDAEPLVLWRDQQRARDAIVRLSARDAERWPAFAQRMHRLAGFLGLLYSVPPPRPIGGGLGELFSLAKLGRQLRGLGKADMIELLRVMPMSIAELLEDEFESELLNATIGAGGVSGICQGPRSAGTTFVLLHHHVGGEPGTFRLRQEVRGGAAALATAVASAARSAGAELRYGAHVKRLRIANGAVTGVVLETGEEISAKRVVSSADVRTTLLDLAGAAHLDPELVRAVGNVRFRGITARVHYALGELPRFAGLAADSDALRGVLSVAPALNYIERAYDDTKYGRVSGSPVLEITIPSLADPTVAPAGKHVMSVTMQYAPYSLREGKWDNARRNALGDAVTRTLSEYAPNLEAAILERAVITPSDLQSKFGLPEGSVDHGELGLDQILFMRPLPGWSRYKTPIEGLYLGGAGSHPGRAIAGGAGRLAARAVLRK